MTKATLRTCEHGHEYFKSSDCPVCPICESAKNNADHFLSGLSAPARRALEREGITTAQQLSRFSEKELLKLHGLGPSSIPKINAKLAEEGLQLQRR
ncbi:MAG: RNA polymerase alpha subunit C-terminal domain-containing protein [Flavobacteriales bacterium]